ncbi:MAG: ATP synthase F1 subunit delta [Pirellulales bacterium]|nr:ATP synthase F1 subunit delta [Pirellulales bacterium]
MVEDRTARDAQWAAERDVDVPREHVGDVYAEAFLGAAENVSASGALVDVFDSFVDDMLDPFPQFEEVLASRLISHEEKLGILDRVLGPRVPVLFLNFLKVVSRHDRLDCLRAIHRQAHVLYDKLRNRVPVELTTPVEIDDALAQRVADKLRELIGGEPVVSRRTDPDLIGGAVVRVGDTVYDGSIAASLEAARKQMIERSVHEIQSRRDRFRNPAGN